MAGYQPKVYREQGASAFVVAASGKIRVESGGAIAVESGGEITLQAGGVLNASAGSITLPANLKRGYIPLDLFAGRILSSAENLLGIVVNTTGAELGASVGGLLNAGSIPTLTMNSTVNGAALLTWASGQNAAVAFPPIPIPPDFASAGGLSIHAIAERASDNASNNVLDFRFWNGANTSEKGTTGATMTSTPAEYSAVISSAEVGGHPGYWNVRIVPGTHTNNAVKVYAGWLEYSRATS